MKSTAKELVLYFLASLVALSIDMGIYAALINWTNCPAPISASISYTVGLVVAYILMVKFVFNESSRTQKPLAEFAIFTLTGLIGIGVTYATVYGLTEIFHLADAVWAKIFAVGCSFVIVYLSRKLFLFKS